MFDEQASEFSPLSPAGFFQMSAGCHFAAPPFPSIGKKNVKKYLLSDTSDFISQHSFAEIAMGWNKEGIEVFLKSHQPFFRANYPKVESGDSLELFFDTRDVKASGFNTPFCHHFFFLPEAVDGTIAGEITRFRGDASRPLCNPENLNVKSSFGDDSYQMQVFIPAECLYGYDPDQFDRIGFTYRVNRCSGKPQCFSVSPDDYAFEQLPSLWSSIRLVP